MTITNEKMIYLMGKMQYAVGADGGWYHPSAFEVLEDLIGMLESDDEAFEIIRAYCRDDKTFEDIKAELEA